MIGGKKRKGSILVEGYSVLMSVYARENAHWLTAAVESMLRQTVPPEEFILVCDGPLSQALNAVIADFCSREPDLFRIVRLPENQGLGTALNAGLAVCRTELVARMDSDDIALPDRMERQLAMLEQHPEIDVLGGQVAEFDGSPEHLTAYRRVPGSREAIGKYLRYRSPMNHTTVVFRKSCVLQAGGYGDVIGFEDYLLWAQMAHVGFCLENIPEICCYMRAGRELYRRRGGLGYFCNAMKMLGILLNQGILTPGEYCQNVVLRFVGALLLPAALRQQVVLLFLRDRVEESAMPRMFLEWVKT